MAVIDYMDLVQPIKIKEQLGEFLGSFDECIDIGYLDIVKYAGHSCPTVASAFISIKYALENIYKEDIPFRGDIEVFAKNGRDVGVNGVISNVFSFVTGARESDGFKGIGGKFNRSNLLHFDSDIKSEYKILSLSLEKSVEFDISLSLVPFNPEMNKYLTLALNGGDKEDQREFMRLWQERVKAVLRSNPDDICKIY